MAPYLPLHPNHTTSGPPRLSNRHYSHGQAQTDLGPIDGLRRLRCRHWLYRRVRYWEEDATEAVLQADYQARSAQVVEHGGYDEEVGWRGDSEEGGQWHVAEE